MSSNSNTLVGYAVLRANYNAQASSYIDNFQAFALDVLATEHPRPTSSHDVAVGIHDRFGLYIPDLVVGKILRRARTAKFVVGDPQKGFSLTDQGLKEAPEVGKLATDYSRRQTELVAKFRLFVLENHQAHKALLDADLAEKLGNYFEAHAVPLLAQSLRGESLPMRQVEPGYDYLISSFVAHCAEQDSSGFAHVEDAVKGAILAAVVLLDTSSLESSLSKVTLYLDTPVLIDVLGYHGDAAQLAAEQMLALARKLGARVAVFEHNVRELEGVLSHAEYALRTSGSRKESTGQMLAEFVKARVTPVDVALYRDRLPQDLTELRIEIRPRPDFAAYNLDETLLEEELEKSIRYRNPAARKHDVDSLSAIHRLRRGENSSKLERSRAMLITTNGGLARASQQFTGEEHVWPLAMTESAIASLLWVRSPVVSEELPRKQLLATAYAGMQPDSYLWGKYLDEVAVLENRGELRPEDALLLRVGMEPRLALMEATAGESDEISPETLVDVLDRLKHETTAPLAAELSEVREREAHASKAANEASASWLEQQDANDRLRKEVEEANTRTIQVRTEMNALSKRDQDRKLRIRDRAQKNAQRIIRTVGGLFGGLLALCATLSFVFPHFDVVPPIELKIVLLSAGALLIGLATLREIIPGTVAEWLTKMEQPLADRLAGRHLRRAGYEEE